MEFVLDLIPGLLYSRLAVTRREVSEEYLERLTSVILAGIRADAYSNTDVLPEHRRSSTRPRAVEASCPKALA